MKLIYKLFIPYYNDPAIPYRIKKQLPYMLLTNLFLLLAFVLLIPLILVSGASQSTLFLAAFIVLDIVLVLSLVFLRSRKYVLCSYSIMAVLFLSSYVVLFLMPYTYRTPEALYRPFAFIAVMGAVNTLIALQKRQIIVFYLGSMLGVFLAYGTVYRDLLAMNQTVLFSVLGATVLGLSFEQFIFYQIKKLSDILIHDAELETQKTTEAVINKAFLQKTQSSMSIGDQILQAGNEVSASVEAVHQLNQNLSQGSEKLLQESAAFAVSSQAVDQSSQVIAKNADEQIIAINETTAAITQILSNIESISTIAQKRRVMLDELDKNSKSQQKLMRQLGKTAEEVSDSSTEIQDFVQTIEDIAGRTNLLSMNASIQAARAGKSGEGFSVVAQEIRSLSKETEENATVIKKQLGNNAHAIQTLTTMISDFSLFLETSLNSNQQLIEAIDEILRGVGEMSSGSHEILTAVQAISDTTHVSKEEIANLLSQIQTQRFGFKEIKQFSEELHSYITVLEQQVQQLQHTVTMLHDSGNENKAQIQKMQSSLK